MRIVILSDIHANVTAFKAVLTDISTIGKVDAYAIIGDLVNYGPRPNEIIEMTKGLDKPLLVNLWGNHEYSIFGGSLERFATDRGRAVLRYTNSILTKESHDYLDKKMEHSGFLRSQIDGKSFQFMHGIKIVFKFRRAFLEFHSDTSFLNTDLLSVTCCAGMVVHPSKSRSLSP